MATEREELIRLLVNLREQTFNKATDQVRKMSDSRVIDLLAQKKLRHQEIESFKSGLAQKAQEEDAEDRRSRKKKSPTIKDPLESEQRTIVTSEHTVILSKRCSDCGFLFPIGEIVVVKTFQSGRVMCKHLDKCPDGDSSTGFSAGTGGGQRVIRGTRSLGG